jgi:hypothetical protein
MTSLLCLQFPKFQSRHKILFSSHFISCRNRVHKYDQDDWLSHSTPERRVATTKVICYLPNCTQHRSQSKLRQLVRRSSPPPSNTSKHHKRAPLLEATASNQHFQIQPLTSISELSSHFRSSEVLIIWNIYLFSSKLVVGKLLWRCRNSRSWISVEEIPLCFKYINKTMQYVLRLAQLYVYFIVILLLATRFGLKRPSSGQYLQKKLKMLLHMLQNGNFMGSNWHPFPPKVPILWRSGGACVVTWSQELCWR